jgi:phosphatidylserine/phosphatidylglycerophosphate/cardiolipin synthase-like enzyme
MSSHRTRLSLALACFLIVCVDCPYPSASAFASPADAPAIDAYFSPNGGATGAILRELNNARKEILVQAYSLTSASIGNALVNAYKRGVKVIVILDKGQQGKKFTSADFLLSAGIPTHLDDQHRISHNNIIIIDQSTVITGSMNFTKAAEERNAENLLVIRGYATLGKKYFFKFQEHLGHSEAYKVEGS